MKNGQAFLSEATIKEKIKQEDLLSYG